jgi:glucokinase
VLAHPRKVMSEPIADIAVAADVSQPTVIRFCRSLGCDGLSDFKLKLASGMSATLPITHVQVRAGDSISELGAKVMGNTASAILQERERLDWAAVDKVVKALEDASRIDIHAIGHAAAVAIDAQYKFMRVGRPSAAYTDQRLQLLSADAARAGDLLLFISASGNVSHLVEVCEHAKARGASTVAITSQNSALAKACDMVLAVEHSENIEVHLAMVSRVLQLLMVDVLAVSLAAGRSGFGASQTPSEWDDLPARAAGQAGRGSGAIEAGLGALSPKNNSQTAGMIAGLAAVTSHGL